MYNESMKTLKQIFEHFGGAANLARKLGISRQAVSQWVGVPEYRAGKIARISGGALKVSDMPIKAFKPGPKAD